MEQFLEILNEGLKKFSPFMLGGIIGAIIHRLRNKMTFKRFLSSVAISMFVALCTGIVARDYFNLQESIVYVLCGVSGVFSESILDELEENIKNVSVIIKSKFGVSTPEITENVENE